MEYRSFISFYIRDFDSATGVENRVVTYDN